MALTRLLAKARALDGSTKPDELQAFIDDLLGELLLAEGPPVEPIEGLSEGLRSEIVRTPKGRPRAIAHTWTTGTWRCLLIDTESVPMGRPMFRVVGGAAKGQVLSSRSVQVVLPSRTQKALNRIAWAADALKALGLAQPIAEGAVHVVLGEHRTFIAWRPREVDEPFNSTLRGDVDNYAKTVLDGLQAGGILHNDRGVVRLTAVKDAPASWAEPPRELDQAIADMVRQRHGKGEDYETARVSLRLTKNHLKKIVPDYKPPRSAKDPALTQQERTQAASAALELAATPTTTTVPWTKKRQEAAQKAVALISEGTPYMEARRQTGATPTFLRPLLANHLRARVLDTSITTDELAGQLGTDHHTILTLFAHDQVALAALRSRRSEQRAAPGACRRAAEDVLHGLRASQAARKHRVKLQSLYAHISRTRKAQRQEAAITRPKAKKGAAKK